MRYFAYGSNMHPRRLSLRVPSATPLGWAGLPGWLLGFHKRGSDGSAKCTLRQVPSPTDPVYGVIYQIDPEEKAGLDCAEGLGAGYEETWADLPHYGRVFFYVASPDYLAEGLLPFTWYKAFVVEGARHHGLPEGYIRIIEQIHAVEDPDALRHRKNWKILKSLPNL